MKIFNLSVYSSDENLKGSLKHKAFTLIDRKPDTDQKKIDGKIDKKK